jgi:rhodanese-related sulfurtransferase
MQPTLLYRSAALITLALAAGAVHSLVLGAGGKRVTTVPLAPAPLILPVPPTNGEQPAAQPANGTPQAQPPTQATQPAQATPPPVAPADPMDQLNITIAQAKALFDQNVIFIDARPLHEYEAGHVPNAFFLSTETYHGSEVLEYLDPTSPMVIYCGGGACDASKNLVILLQQSGYMGGRIMHDGYPAWAAAGHPTATGKPLIGGPK